MAAGSQNMETSLYETMDASSKSQEKIPIIALKEMRENELSSHTSEKYGKGSTNHRDQIQTGQSFSSASTATR